MSQRPTHGSDERSDMLRHRELEVSREIADAFLSASSPVGVYRLALARVTPLVEASFASVFVRDAADPELLRLVCAQNWPQSSARFLDRMRIRVGRGPTGRAVAEVRPVEVEDVFATPALDDWWEIARELGFVSLIALPLRGDKRVPGALTFYFEDRRAFSEAERGFLERIAGQLARLVERADLIEELRQVNERLRSQNEKLKRTVRSGADDGGGVRTG